MNNSGNKKGKTKKSVKEYVIQFLSILLIMFVIFQGYEVVRVAMADKDRFDVRKEVSELYSQAGENYFLYIDGNDKTRVDWNEYALLDESGNTDFKYCYLMQCINRFMYTLFVCSMLYIVLMIYRNSVSGTPFTKGNIKLVKVISLLQLGLAFVPELVKKTMSLVRFNYIYSVIDIERVYMLGIAVVICGIAYIFEKGLILREDVESIA